MNSKFLKLNLIVLFLVINLTAYSQPEGTVLENRKITSSILGKEMCYSVYLPPDYKTSERDYPVIYLLHGIRMNSTSWIQEGEIKRYVDKAIEDGTIPTMILIMPDAGKTYYINSADGKLRYEDSFIKELIPDVEKIYRIRSEKRYRGIAGIAMGGYGALYLALKHPDFFSAATPNAAAFEKKVPHEFRVRDGAHNWNYWHSGIVETLKYIGEASGNIDNSKKLTHEKI